MWVGGIVMSFIMGATVFKVLDKDRTLAGAIFGAVLEAGNRVKVGLGLAALATEALIFFSSAPDAPQGWRRFVPAGSLILAMLLALTVTFWLEPHMRDLQNKIKDFSQNTVDNPLRQRFRSLHGLSMGLLFAEGIAVLIAFLSGLL